MAAVPPALSRASGPQDLESQLSQIILAELANRSTVPVGTPGLPAPLEGPPAHTIVAARAWPWLPTLDHGHLAPHPYCGDCGGVKYVGSLRAIKFGGLVAMASALSKKIEASGRRVTEAQFRLIVKALEAEGAGDGFVMSREMQERALLRAICRYTGVDDATLRSYLRAP